MEEPIKLLYRVRPPQCEGKIFWTVSQNSVTGVEGIFVADKVFDVNSTNRDVFQSIFTLIEKLCEGYNTAILAYGQSGAGKTHTLLGDEREEGLVNHIIKHLFRELVKQQNNEGRSFLVQLHVMEIYCEKIKDLLCDSSGIEPVIMEGNNNIPRVINIRDVTITSAEQALSIIQEAQKRRVTGTTELNDKSSRSHAIIQLAVETSLSIGSKSNMKTRKSVMSIVDLAGSENAEANSGIRAKEGALINKSLLYLTKVISILTEKSIPGHIPYRNSKLTRLLKPCLGGNASTLIICCIHPQNKDESIRTLKFSERLKLVKSRVTVNEDEEDSKLNALLEEIGGLKERLNTSLCDIEVLRIRNAKLEEKNEVLTSLLTDAENKNKEIKKAVVVERAVDRKTICELQIAIEKLSVIQYYAMKEDEDRKNNIVQEIHLDEDLEEKLKSINDNSEIYTGEIVEVEAANGILSDTENEGDGFPKELSNYDSTIKTRETLDYSNSSNEGNLTCFSLVDEHLEIEKNALKQNVILLQERLRRVEITLLKQDSCIFEANREQLKMQDELVTKNEELVELHRRLRDYELNFIDKINVQKQEHEKDSEIECVFLRQSVKNLEERLQQSEEKLQQAEEALQKKTKVLEEGILKYNSLLKEHKDLYSRYQYLKNNKNEFF